MKRFGYFSRVSVLIFLMTSVFVVIFLPVIWLDDPLDYISKVLSIALSAISAVGQIVGGLCAVLSITLFTCFFWTRGYSVRFTNTLFAAMWIIVSLAAPILFIASLSLFSGLKDQIINSLYSSTISFLVGMTAAFFLRHALLSRLIKIIKDQPFRIFK